MSAHTCDACVVSCIDFRLQKHLCQWTDKYLAGKTFDFIRLAGASKELEIILKQIDISFRLHKITEVVLIQHEDCGAYGNENAHEEQIKDLKKAREKILEKYPHFKIDLYYLYLNGEFEVVI